MERIERGWAGHFICAHHCRFRRNTLLKSGDVSIVVSTVGAFYPHNSKNMETVGFNRWYETMAFFGEEDENGHIDANVEKQIEFTSEWGIFGDYETLPNNVDIVADIMHEAVVAEISAKNFDK